MRVVMTVGYGPSMVIAVVSVRTSARLDDCCGLLFAMGTHWEYQTLLALLAQYAPVGQAVGPVHC